MSVFVTGDTHGGVDVHKFKSKFVRELGITENDYLIICGDFGFPFLSPDFVEEHISSKEYRKYKNQMESDFKMITNLPCKYVLFIDGNHDNHPYWDNLPVTEMFGGKVHIHPWSDKIIHLMRGEIYTIEDKTYFTMGGATSIDKWRRTPDINWWAREIPSDEEFQNGKDNLAKVNNKVNYIITHTCPLSLVYRFIGAEYGMSLVIDKQHDEVAKYLEEIMATVEFDQWYCGHLHTDRYLSEFKIQCLYNQIMEV